MTKRPRFRTRPDSYGIDGFYCTVPLSRGYRLRMDLYLFEPDWLGGRYEVDVALMAYPGRYSLSRAMDKEGTATGPGGVEVVYPALEILEAAGAEALKRWGHYWLRLRVDAANETLYRVYKRFLTPRGFRATEWELELIKDLN